MFQTRDEDARALDTLASYAQKGTAGRHIRQEANSDIDTNEAHGEDSTTSTFALPFSSSEVLQAPWRVSRGLFRAAGRNKRRLLRRLELFVARRCLAMFGT